MAKRTESPSSPSAIGVATTTPVAFVHEGQLFLERMSALSEEGSGILSDTLPAKGSRVQLAFRVSTAARSVRCMAEVVGHFPTTPAGLKLRKKHGDRTLKASMGAAIGDSATAVFRMSDLESARRGKPGTRQAPAMATGFSVRFVELGADDRAVIDKHVQVSRRMSEQLAARGEQLVELGTDERATLGALFDEGDLSKRALDW